MRFLENHDEPRAAATFPPPVHKAAAVVALLARGLRFFYEGQLEGRKVHVVDAPRAPAGRARRQGPAGVLPALARVPAAPRGCTTGEWRLESCRPAWAGNATARAVHRRRPGRRASGGC